jgi:hypothetical protein
MKVKSQIKPNKTASLAGFIIGLAFMVFGIVFYLVLLPEMDFEDGSGYLISLFFVIWTLVVLFIALFNARNYFSSQGISVIDMDFESEKDETPVQDTIEIRLRRLERLRNDSLITESEFNQKREEILREKW